MKPVISIEQGKVLVEAKLEKKLDKDGDGVSAAEIEVSSKVKLDLYEFLNEVRGQDSALLAAVLAQLNYKPASE